MQHPESPPTSFGGYLRSLREAKGSSLEDMARSTRVGIRHLEAIEEERLTDLPSPVFVRGFIRAYCGFLRESPDEALGQYQALAGARAAVQAARAPLRPRGGGLNSSVLVGLALLVVLGLGLFAINLTVKRTGGTSVAAPKMEATTPASSPPVIAPPAAPDPPPVASVAPAKSAPGAQRLLIKAVEATWIRVQPDEGRASEETLPAGASREWSAERRFLVTIGNAGGVELTLNGKILPPLGVKGAVIQRLELPQAPTSGS
ncbi:MAG: helix-turn-helix domain-containing protein [Candidatus Rokuibacteriota bacterium]